MLFHQDGEAEVQDQYTTLPEHCIYRAAPAKRIDMLYTLP